MDDFLASERARSLRKSKSMNMRNFEVFKANQELNASFLDRNNSLSFANEAPSTPLRQMRGVMEQERVLRSAASASRLPSMSPFGGEDTSTIDDMISAVDDFHLGSDVMSRSDFTNFNSDRSQLHKTQSMRYPPGFNDFHRASHSNIFRESPRSRLSQNLVEEKHLKRFVTFAGEPKLSLSRSNDLNLGEISDDEDIQVSVVDEEGLLMDFTPSRLRSEEVKELKRIDSRQKMRKAFPKTVFDNVDEVEIDSFSPPQSPISQQSPLFQQTLQNQMLVDLMVKQQNMIQSLQRQQMTFQNQQFLSFQQSPPQTQFGERQLSPLLLRHKTSGFRPSLQELRGHVVEFSRDSHGSRLIQSLMESAKEEEKVIIANEVLPEAVALMQDLFGNYVLQNFLQHCNKEQREVLAEEIQKSMLLLSFQPHGCRVVQRAIEVLRPERRNRLLQEITSSSELIKRCAKDPHATHVLQKAVVFLQKENFEESREILERVEESLASEVLQLAVHPHACRLVQRTMGDCDVERSKHVKVMVNAIKIVFPMLSVDQHGNFILQHFLDRGSEEQKQLVQTYVAGRFLELAQHKFGSHLVEKCLNVANKSQADVLVKELLKPALKFRETKVGEDVLLTLMKDPYANFVVQRAFDASSGHLRKLIVREVLERSEELSRFTYGRHILSHVNKTKGSY